MSIVNQDQREILINTMSIKFCVIHRFPRTKRITEPQILHETEVEQCLDQPWK